MQRGTGRKPQNRTPIARSPRKASPSLCRQRSEMSSGPQLGPQPKPFSSPCSTGTAPLALGHRFSCPLALTGPLPINDTEWSQQGRAGGLGQRDHHGGVTAQVCRGRFLINCMGLSWSLPTLTQPTVFWLLISPCPWLPARENLNGEHLGVGFKGQARGPWEPRGGLLECPLLVRPSSWSQEAQRRRVAVPRFPVRASVPSILSDKV